ncbi:ABC transporter substrate-binding protein [Streptomyces sp. BE303]|uniref:ABC transporter substrate-binding protein n=1 Tax=Streptomyces sp. BE303 TaxID=3002528 RepID=UPI002E79A351|nr:ABC transporter substrate-binding protein [Streptomyces sp. BE303]MED7947868.1 ABC transporter substrate-binding protein [Streptomyces sp. BE303]
MMRQKRQAALRLLLVLTLLTASASCLGGSSGGRVLVIMTPWTAEAEMNAFQAVLTAFEVETGITVRASPTRALDQVLRTAVQKREAPDLAVMANPGALRSYAQQGDLVRLDRFRDEKLGRELVDLLRSDYGPPWSHAGEAVNGDPYAVMVKASVKSLIWYAPQRLGTQPPDSWADLVGIGRSIVQRGEVPWCLALADPPNSGWPGTDWIEDILLHQSGADIYTDWVDGNLSWTSSQVGEAWQAWGQIFTAQGSIHGGPLTALLTGYGEGAYPLFTAPPGCYLEHGAPITPGPAATKPLPGNDYDFVPFPEFRTTSTPAYEVSGDLVAMFHDSPEAERFMAFLASPQAQQIWPSLQPESAFSANRAVTTRSASGHATGSVARRIDELLTSSATLCFDASDSMPSTMAAAFNHAVLDYLNDPTRLPTILAGLDKVRADAYPQPTQSSVCTS